MKYLKLPFLLPVLFAAFISCNQLEHKAPTNDIASIGMKWELVSNFSDSGYTARISLVNKKEQQLTDKNWAVFFSIAPSPLLEPGEPQPARLEHLNGDWYKLSPNAGFSLSAGDSVDIIYKATEGRIKETDQPLGIYIVFYDAAGKEERIAKIEDYTPVPFTRREQLLRGTADMEAPASAAKTYWENIDLSVLEPGQLLPIIPTPAYFSQGSGSFTLEGNAIHYTASLQNEADILSAKLKAITGKDFAVSEGNVGNKNIYLSVNPSAVTAKKPEAYRLHISENGITITGADAAGVFYGVQSLLALIPTQA
ncbi:MAG TPA: glycoside hydrolase family 20 zincin-like fold domain-containing protein, partial [Agriterribacter sp.]|nr:glycoside hydrolase family 20 zincin-like fold domain-containing protein [Agriterribacter sp.]